VQKIRCTFSSLGAKVEMVQKEAIELWVALSLRQLGQLGD
jgi:hypothetical protein